MTHKITIERNKLRFSAAHFTTFGGECEPLHGHNYDLFVEIEGSLTDDSWVVDFSAAKRLVAGICDELDHKFLLPTLNTSLNVTVSGSECEITFGDRRYVMPDSDVVQLEIDNSTAERLAEWFAGRIRSGLRELGADNIVSLTVGVEEAPGQTGWFTLGAKDA